jgi:plasmid maintenance system antidote protein VapI
MAKEYRVSERIKRLPTHLGEVLGKDVLPALDLSVREAADQLGVTRQTLHRISRRSSP